MIEFEPKKHVYTLEGKEIPSVSEITRFLSREVYKDADQAAMDIAADRGTRVHKACEEFDVDGLVACDEDIAGYVSAYAAFIREHDVDWKMIEEPVYREDLWIAGTVDRYGLVDGEPTILDIKTTKTISGKHKIQYGAQLDFYKLMIKNAPDSAKEVILQLKEDGTYKMIEVEENLVVAVACMTLHKTFEKTKQKRKRRLPNG